MMHYFSMFSDELKKVTQWFSQRNDCERTVVLYSLLRFVSPNVRRFLDFVIQNSLTDCTELQYAEREANDCEFVSNLCSENVGRAVSALITHLPLLNPYNQEAKKQYLKLLPRVFQFVLETQTYHEEARQLISFALIHPALSLEERRSLEVWRQSIEHVKNGHQQKKNGVVNQSHSQYDLSGDPAYSKHFLMTRQDSWSVENDVNGAYTDRNLDIAGSGPEVFRQHPLAGQVSVFSDTVTSVVTDSHGITNPHGNATVVMALETNGQQESHWGLHNEHVKNPETVALSPQGSLTSSGSDNNDDPQERNSFMDLSSGMKDVPTWLKSLRLHKYASLFSKLKYEDMLELTEDWLEAQSVTKGARTKILINIQKLKERQTLLQNLEKEVLDGANIKSILGELREMLLSPIRAYSSNNKMAERELSVDGDTSQCIPEGDLPCQFTRTMGKVCTQLLVSNRPDVVESCWIYSHLIDKCVSHDAFTLSQKKRLETWQYQIQKNIVPIVPQRVAVSGKPPKGWSPQYQPGAVNLMTGVPPQRVRRMPPQRLGMLCAKGGPVTQSAISPPQNKPMMSQSFNKPRPVDDRSSVQRTKSAPARPTTALRDVLYQKQPATDFGSSALDTDINNSLEYLCKSMTEHALGETEKTSNE